MHNTTSELWETVLSTVLNLPRKGASRKLQTIRSPLTSVLYTILLQDDDMVLPMVDVRPSMVTFTFGLAAASSSAASSSLPASMSAQVVATYSSDTGEARVQMADVLLPLCLFCQAVPPVKDAGALLPNSMLAAWPLHPARRRL